MAHEASLDEVSKSEIDTLRDDVRAVRRGVEVDAQTHAHFVGRPGPIAIRVQEEDDVESLVRRDLMVEKSMQLAVSLDDVGHPNADD